MNSAEGKKLIDMTSAIQEKAVLSDANVVVIGGTGSLGQQLVRRILAGEVGTPRKLTVLSRDEAKQYQMRIDFDRLVAATHEVFYKDYSSVLHFWVGDVRDFSSVLAVLKDADYVFCTAALKQVPTCEYFPYQAVLTNIVGAENIVRAIRENGLPVKQVVGISTDKACKPVNVMGMTKALQERLFVRANLDCPQTRFNCVRYGNVLASRGSVLPLFLDQVARGGPVTVTTETMTRFFLSLDRAVDTIFAALQGAQRGEIYVPIIPAARIIDVAEVLVGDRDIEIQTIGIRPGEKEHEVMISEEESHRTEHRGRYYVILPMLPELQPKMIKPAFPEGGEYSSSAVTMTQRDIFRMLEENNLIVPSLSGERI